MGYTAWGSQFQSMDLPLTRTQAQVRPFLVHLDQLAIAVDLQILDRSRKAVSSSLDAAVMKALSHMGKSACRQVFQRHHSPLFVLNTVCRFLECEVRSLGSENKGVCRRMVDEVSQLLDEV